MSIDSQGYRIAKAIDWLKLRYAEPFSVEKLAARVQMSTPTFHHHFRQLTAMSPLQYQKWLRLNEAKRLMLNEHMDSASAAFKVGYESPSQFSREYSRLFGAPPKRDIAALRETEPAKPSMREARAS
ncbi:AraC-like DNA-binding protein [Variovorax guangxiensis]|nr:AraC-like DNA-binding protein [Variovorax guangxiensis]